MFAEIFNFLINGHLQGEVHQAWIPLAIAAAGMAYGAYQGNEQAKAAERKDKLNAELGALDTAYSPFVASKGRSATYTDRGGGALGGGFGGALSGYQTGAGIEQGINRNNAYEELLNNSRNAQAQQVAQGGGIASNPYSSYMGKDYSSQYSAMGGMGRRFS